MKKVMVLFVVLFLVAGVLAVAGCGEEKVVVEEDEVIDLNEPVSHGIVGTFVEGMSATDAEGKKSITFVAEGTFEGDAWDASKSGKYEVDEGEEEGEHPSVVLTFDDGTTEKWSVMIVDGKVYALGSTEGQYTKK